MAEFLSYDSPPQRPAILNSPPLFPRIPWRRSAHGGVKGDEKNGTSDLICIANLAPMLQVAPPELVDDENDDINNHHMEVVNGWGEFKSPGCTLRRDLNLIVQSSDVETFLASPALSTFLKQERGR